MVLLRHDDKSFKDAKHGFLVLIDYCFLQIQLAISRLGDFELVPEGCSFFVFKSLSIAFIEVTYLWFSAMASHLHRAVILDDGLENGPHHVRIRTAEEHHPDANGTALRVFHLLLN